jgi:hypothetical protein
VTSNVTVAEAFVKITPPSAARLIPNHPGTSPSRHPSADGSPGRLSATARVPDTTASRTSESRFRNASTVLDPCYSDLVPLKY